MILSWNIQHLFSSPVSITALTIFLLCLIIAIVCLIVLAIYRRIMHNIAISCDLLEAIQKNPLRPVLLKVEQLNNNANGALYEKIIVWRTKYELVYENQFIKAARMLVDFLVDKKSFKPTLSNLRKAKNVYIELQDISQKVYEIQQEIKNETEVESILRNAVIDFKRILIDVKREVDIFNESIFNFDQQKLDSTIKQVEDLFEAFYLALEKGDYNNAWNCIEQIYTATKFLIEMLDNIPHAHTQIKQTIPNKLNDLKNKHVITNKTDKQEINAIKFKALETRIDELRYKADNLLYKLQFKTANKLIGEINQLIELFGEDVSSTDKLKEFFTSYENDINDYLDQIKNINVNFSKSFDSLAPINKPKPNEFYQFEDFRKKFEFARQEIEQIYAIIDTSTINNKPDYSALRERMVSALNNIIEALDGYNIINEYINLNIVNGEVLLNDITFAKSIIIQTQVRVNQYLSIENLKRTQSIIDKILEKINSYTPKYLSSLSKNQIEDTRQEISKLTNDAWKISNNVTNEIFTDYISQEIITYMERFVDKDQIIEQWIDNLETKFKNGDFTGVISSGIGYLAKLKKIR